MNAMPAVALRQYENERRSSKALVRKNGKKAKVINLKLRKPKSTGELSPTEQEAIILEFRLKARSLAHSILRRWRSRIDSQEVESVVDLSLCEAARRFNKNKGVSFITFLFYHLRGNLIRTVSTAAANMYVPLPDFDAMDSGEVSGVNKGKFLNAIDIAETLSSSDYVAPDESLLKKQLSKLSTEACAKLDDLEREVVYRIYVLEEPLMDIAKSLGYSRCHISRVKRKALEALHRELSANVYPEGGAGRPDFSDDGIKFRRKARRLVTRRPRAAKREEIQYDDIYAV